MPPTPLPQSAIEMKEKTEKREIRYSPHSLFITPKKGKKRVLSPRFAPLGVGDFNMVEFENEGVLPYRKARLVVPAATKKDLRLYIEYYAWDTDRGKLRRVRNYQINAVPKSLQQDYARQSVAAINTGLLSGMHFNEKKRLAAIALRRGEVNRKDFTLEFALDFVLKFNFKGMRHKSQQSYKSIGGLFATWVAETIGPNILARDITATHIKDWLSEKQAEQGISNATINARVNGLKSLFEQMIEAGIRETNPAKGMKKRRVERGKNYPFNAAQKLELESWMIENNPRLFYFTRFIFYAFVRPNELGQLQRKHIFMEDWQIQIPSEISKTGRTQFINIEPELMMVLHEMKVLEMPAETYLFSKGLRPGKVRLHTNRFGEAHRQALMALEFTKEYNLYSWKHTGVRHAVNEKKQDIIYIKTQLRHSSLDDTYTYAQSIGAIKTN